MTRRRYTHIRKATKPRKKHEAQQPPRTGPTVPRFKAITWTEIKGLPAVWVLCDRERPRDGSDLNGQPVIIDGRRFVCREVHLIVTLRRHPGESQAAMARRIREELKQPIRPGEKIGLVLSGAN